MQKIIKLYVLVCLSLCLFLQVATSSDMEASPQVSPKVALVTGANRGIGFALTIKLLEEGLEVYAVARNPEPLRVLQTSYPLLHIIEADLSTLAGQKKAAAKTLAPINYIIHNAAVINPLGPNSLLDPSNVDALAILMQVNVMAPMIINAELGDRMTGARVLMISSIAGDRMAPGLGAYCVSKACVDRYTQSLQMDNLGIVFAAAVHPGEVDTGMQEDLRRPDAINFPNVELFQRRHDEGKLITPETSAAYLRWLLLETENDYFTSMKHDIYNESHRKHWLAGQVLPVTN